MATEYTVTNIKYDTDGENIELPKEIEIEVPDGLSDEHELEFLSDEISDVTGFCHFGFNIKS